MVDWPDDTLVEQLPAPAFTAALIFSLSFLIVCNMDSARLSAFLMAAVDSPLWGHDAQRSLKKKKNHCKNTKEDDRENVNKAAYEHKRKRIRGRGTVGEGRLMLPQALHLLSPLPLPTSQRPSDVTVHSNASAWVTSTCRFDLVVFGFSAFMVLCRLTLMRGQKSCITV